MIGRISQRWVAPRSSSSRTPTTRGAPRASRRSFPFPCEHWLGDGDEPVPGLHVLEMHGSKTPGELALVLERTTLITGDLVRGHMGGKLNLLPDAKLTDHAQAIASVQRIP